MMLIISVRRREPDTTHVTRFITPDPSRSSLDRTARVPIEAPAAIIPRPGHSLS